MLFWESEPPVQDWKNVSVLPAKASSCSSVNTGPSGLGVREEVRGNRPTSAALLECFSSRGLERQESRLQRSGGQMGGSWPFAPTVWWEPLFAPFPRLSPFLLLAEEEGESLKYTSTVWTLP